MEYMEEGPIIIFFILPQAQALFMMHSDTHLSILFCSMSKHHTLVYHLKLLT